MSSLPHTLSQPRPLEKVRWLAAIGLAVLIAGSVWGGVRPEAPAIPGSYVLSGFKVLPYDDPRTDGKDKDLAVISYVSSWSNDTFPGDGVCRFRLFDSSGHEVGSLKTEFTSYSNEAQRTSTAPIPLTGRAVTASGNCEGSAP